MKRYLALVAVIGVAVALYGGSGEVSGPETSYGGTPGYRVWRANGHSQAKNTVKSGDVINSLQGYGYNGSAFTTSIGVGMYLKANQDWTTTANGTKITFETTPDDSTTAAEVMSIDDNGNVAISGTTSFTGDVSISSVTISTQLNMGGPFVPFSQTEAELKVSTPTIVGAIYYDSTNKEFVQSTGTTTCADYAKIEDPTATPDGW